MVGGTESNAGAGLFFIKSMAKMNKDFFAIYSGKAMYKLLKSPSKKNRLNANPFTDRHSAGDDVPNWQGTAVGVDISPAGSNMGFGGLLDLIGDVYQKEIRQLKMQQFRRPKFV